MPTITVLQPDPEVPLGRFEPWLTEAGMQLELVPLWNAELPQIADGLLILGGRMNCHAEAEHPWLPGVRRLVASAVENGTPTLGICLGHQILAEALGGAVTVDHPDDPMLGSLATQGSCPVAMSHRDVVTRLPPGAIELARTDRFAHQVFRAGSAVGVQFHPEASPEQVARWAELTGGDAAGDRAALTAVDTEVSAAARAVAYGFADQLGATRTTR